MIIIFLEKVKKILNEGLKLKSLNIGPVKRQWLDRNLDPPKFQCKITFLSILVNNLGTEIDNTNFQFPEMFTNKSLCNS